MHPHIYTCAFIPLLLPPPRTSHIPPPRHDFGFSNFIECITLRATRRYRTAYPARLPSLPPPSPFFFLFFFFFCFSFNIPKLCLFLSTLGYCIPSFSRPERNGDRDSRSMKRRCTSAYTDQLFITISKPRSVLRLKSNLIGRYTYTFRAHAAVPYRDAKVI